MRVIRRDFAVPAGVVVPDTVFQEFLEVNGLRRPIAVLCADLDVNQPETFRRTAETIRSVIERVPLPERLTVELESLLGPTLVVRSSAVGEDSAQAAFAGVREFPVRVKCATLAWHTLHNAIIGARDPAKTE